MGGNRKGSQIRSHLTHFLIYSFTCHITEYLSRFRLSSRQTRSRLSEPKLVVGRGAKIVDLKKKHEILYPYQYHK